VQTRGVEKDRQRAPKIARVARVCRHPGRKAEEKEIGGRKGGEKVRKSLEVAEILVEVSTMRGTVAGQKGGNNGRQN